MRWKIAIPLALALLVALPALPVNLVGTPSEALVNGLGPVTMTQVASGLVNPIGIFNADDGSGRLFFIEQRGIIRVMDGGVLQPTPWMDMRAKVQCCGERGLLGMAFHPDFATNGILFLSFSRAGPGGAFDNVIQKFVVSPPRTGTPDPNSGVDFLVITNPFSNHNGGNIVFGPDGYLYWGKGDGGSGGDPFGNGQNPNTLLGKMLRLDVDHPDAARGKLYSIPNGNPFRTGGGAPEVYMMGLRNPWRWSFDRQTGDLWIGDVGQNLNEEVDYIPAGMGAGWNFGWNRWEGHLMYTFPSTPTGFIFPVAEYPHGLDCSITGGYLYRGPSETLQGTYLYGDYCSGILRGARGAVFPIEIITGAGHTGAFASVPLLYTGKSITAFGEDEAGNVYFTDYNGGAIFRIGAP